VRRQYIVGERVLKKTPIKAARRRHRWCQRISELSLEWPPGHNIFADSSSTPTPLRAVFPVEKNARNGVGFTPHQLKRKEKKKTWLEKRVGQPWNRRNFDLRVQVNFCMGKART